MLAPIMYAAITLGWKRSSMVVTALIIAIAPYVSSFSYGARTLFESFSLLAIPPALVIAIEMLLISSSQREEGAGRQEARTGRGHAPVVRHTRERAPAYIAGPARQRRPDPPGECQHRPQHARGQEARRGHGQGGSGGHQAEQPGHGGRDPLHLSRPQAQRAGQPGARLLYQVAGGQLERRDRRRHRAQHLRRAPRADAGRERRRVQDRPGGPQQHQEALGRPSCERGHGLRPGGRRP